MQIPTDRKAVGIFAVLVAIREDFRYTIIAFSNIGGN